MFDNILGCYDFLNYFFLVGIDKIWWKKVICMLWEIQLKKMFDIVIGMGDFVLEVLKLKFDLIIGVDIFEGMLQVGREKMIRKGVVNVIQF